MTRENLIQAIYENNDRWSCPEQIGETECLEFIGLQGCYECAEYQLAEYEQRIISEALKENKHE